MTKSIINQIKELMDKLPGDQMDELLTYLNRNKLADDLADYFVNIFDIGNTVLELAVNQKGAKQRKYVYVNDLLRVETVGSEIQLYFNVLGHCHAADGTWVAMSFDRRTAAKIMETYGREDDYPARLELGEVGDVIFFDNNTASFENTTATVSAAALYNFTPYVSKCTNGVAVATPDCVCDGDGALLDEPLMDLGLGQSQLESIEPLPPDDDFDEESDDLNWERKAYHWDRKRKFFSKLSTWLKDGPHYVIATHSKTTPIEIKKDGDVVETGTKTTTTSETCWALSINENCSGIRLTFIPANSKGMRVYEIASEVIEDDITVDSKGMVTINLCPGCQLSLTMLVAPPDGQSVLSQDEVMQLFFS